MLLLTWQSRFLAALLLSFSLCWLTLWPPHSVAVVVARKLEVESDNFVVKAATIVVVIMGFGGVMRSIECGTWQDFIKLVRRSR